MKPDRRVFLQQTTLALGMAATTVAGIGLIQPLHAGNKQLPSTSKNAAQVLRQLGATRAVKSEKIALKAPYIAEIGNRIPISVTSHIPNTESIAIIVDHNRQPLVTRIDFTKGQTAYMGTEIKMARDSNVRVLVKANGRYYTTAKMVKVTEGGCGG